MAKAKVGNDYGQITKDVKQESKKKNRIVITILATLVAVAVVVVVIVLLFTLPTAAEEKRDYLHYYAPLDATLGSYSRAAVATDHLVCSQVGNEILKKGGSAVDGAIAALLCVGTANPSGSGIGGGSLTMLYSKKDRQVYAIDSRETGPLAAYPTMFVNRTDAPVHGNQAIAVPGEIAGYYEMWKRFGKLPWSDLFEPTIDLCLKGIAVSRPLRESLIVMEKEIFQYKNMKQMYVNTTTNKTLAEGEVCYDPLFAQTLRRIAQNPFDFYNGSLADDIVDDACEDTGTYPCILTKQDLLTYQVRWRTPLPMTLQTVSGQEQSDKQTVYFFPPPSSSSILALILNVFEKYAPSTADFSTVDLASRFYQRYTEASKYAFAERVYLGDEDFGNFTETLDRLRSKSYAEQIKSRINDSATNLNVSHYLPPGVSARVMMDDGGTSQVSVVDEEGNAVSSTSTVNTRFGSMIRGSKTGIQLNNEMDDFSIPGASNIYNLPPGPYNYPEPGKRPMSSMAPILLLDSKGDVSIVIGASGGPRILSGIVETLIRILWLKDDLKLATDAPRLHHQFLPDRLYYEKTFLPEFRSKLQSFGHSMAEYTSFGGIAIVQTVQVKANKQIDAYSDARKYSGTAGH